MAADGKDGRDKPVVLSRIYTRTGDAGTTALGDGSRVAKDDPRLAAYADVDEANCAIGTALALGGLDQGIAALLTRVQNELFDVGADLCNPVVRDPEYPPLRVDDSYVADLERACDEHNEGLPTLRSFVLPGGTPGAALLLLLNVQPAPLPPKLLTLISEGRICSVPPLIAVAPP